MSRLRDDEIRRLISYLRQQISDESILAEIEDTLRSDEAAEFYASRRYSITSLN